MSFMEPQVTEKQVWYAVDTVNEGICYFPRAEFSRAELADMYDVDVEELDIDEVEGFGARMSAPGYLDCTDWTVFDTAEEAEAYLAEEYGEDEAEETVYEVIVGNIGTVYSGSDIEDAKSTFNVYVEQSKSGVGRAGNESVYLMVDGECEREYLRPIADAE